METGEGEELGWEKRNIMIFRWFQKHGWAFLVGCSRVKVERAKDWQYRDHNIRISELYLETERIPRNKSLLKGWTLNMSNMSNISLWRDLLWWNFIIALLCKFVALQKMKLQKRRRSTIHNILLEKRQWVILVYIMVVVGIIDMVVSSVFPFISRQNFVGRLFLSCQGQINLFGNILMIIEMREASAY